MAEPLVYLSVGDSMSIDTDPYLDLSKSNPSVSQKVGAASLLFENESSIWPEFEGRDLKTLFPGLKHINVATDGATTHDLLDRASLDSISAFQGDATIVTLTLSSVAPVKFEDCGLRRWTSISSLWTDAFEYSQVKQITPQIQLPEGLTDLWNEVCKV